MLKKHLYYFFGYCLLFAFVFRTLLFNLTTNLMDWYDYSFCVWMTNRNLDKLFTLNLASFFDLKILYPNSNAIFFSEILLPQSVLGLPARLFTSNPIFIFNTIFILTFILNYIAVYIFWKTIFKDSFISFIGSLFVIFSSFFFLEIGHFQMLSYWPFFFSLFFLLKSSKELDNRSIYLSGIFCGLQFLASAYLGIFLLSTILIYSIIHLSFDKNRFLILKRLAIIGFSFILITGFFIKKYSDTKKQYSIVRNPNELIQYSAHVSDYLFTKSISSVLHTSPVMNFWNKLDKNYGIEKASFPGFLLTILAITGLLTISITKKRILITSYLTIEALFFILLTLCGMIFSWGPRINFNGNYASIPSLYYLFLKILPPLASVRAPARWSFLFYVGVTYFALSAIKKIKTSKQFLLISLLIFIIFLLEYVPFNLKTHGEKYDDAAYYTLSNLCRNEKLVLLEVPITHFDGNGGITDGLNRVTKYELSSLIHNCFLINGYSGYDLPSLISFKDQFYAILQTENPLRLINFLKENHIDILKVNSEKLSPEAHLSYDKIYPKFVKLDGIDQANSNLYLIK